MPISEIPMEMIYMDLIGPLPETSMGNKFALTTICLLTNYVFMVPMPNKASEFTSQLMHQLASELGFLKVFTSPYTPTGNSIIE